MYMNMIVISRLIFVVMYYTIFNFLFNTERSLRPVLNCDRARQAFENTRKILETLAPGKCFPHFSSVFFLVFTKLKKRIGHYRE